jgi:hypothetical protein
MNTKQQHPMDANSQPTPPQPEGQQQEAAPRKRTVGNRVFDLVVYPSIAFGAVFAFSVWATEKAMFSTGTVRNAFDGLAKKLQESSLLKHLPPEEGFKKAKSHAMVLVSFLAGSLLIAPIKLFEDRRHTISQKIDNALGTAPADPSHYAKEPKQSWLSVMGGRVVTFGSVLALALSVGSHIDRGSMKVASKLTGEIPPGMKPELASKKWQRAYVASFETFYTALCASLVYVLSRTFARKLNKGEHMQDAQVAAGEGTVTASARPQPLELDSSTPLRSTEWSSGVRAAKPVEKAASYTQAVDASRVQASQPALG